MAIVIRIAMTEDKKPVVTIEASMSYSDSGELAMKTGLPAVKVGEEWLLGAQGEEKLAEALVKIVNNGLKHRTAKIPNEVQALAQQEANDVDDDPESYIH